MRRILSVAAAFAIVSSALLSSASAQTWPTRAVHFILPLGAGSGVDITARLFADRLSQKWGQPVIVENRPGGDAFVAIGAVLQAKDDHTLLFAPASTFTAHPLLHDTLPYKPADLLPVARVTNTIIGLGVPTELGVSTVKELADKIKAAPGKFNYASVTGANDLLYAAFLKVEKLDQAKVPYKDTVQAVNDLAEGRIQAYVGAYAILRPRIEQGKVKVIALTNPASAPSLPGIPTARQAGFESLEMDGLVGMFSAPGFPKDAAARIAKDVKDIAGDKDVNDKLTLTGQVVNPGDAAELAAAIKDQQKTVARIGKDLNMKMAQ